MADTQLVYVPVGVGTFELVSAREKFKQSCALLESIDPSFVLPEDILLSVDALVQYLEGKHPGLVVFQNVTFANAAYMTEVCARTACPVVLWTLREPAIDGGRLRLNSLTGAYSAGNTLTAFADRYWEYVFGAPTDPEPERAIRKMVKAVRLSAAMRNLTMAAVGHTPQGFGFGRALDMDLRSKFGVNLISIEARELIDRAKGYTDKECDLWLQKTSNATAGFQATPEKNRLDHARLYKAYWDFVHENHVGALASRCWPDFFTAFGTPVCTVLSMLGDDGVAAACEADMYGALSMWIGMQLTGKPAFFGDPVSLNEAENTITFWHCGAGACSMARKSTGATVGVHPNRKIGPAMDFGCEAFPKATIFRIGRNPDGSFRFFIAPGEALDKPKQFTGTSIVVRTQANSRDIVEDSVRSGWEPHFAVFQDDCVEVLRTLAGLFGIAQCQIYR